MAARSTPNIYTPGAGDTVLPGAVGIDEFFGFFADCGQAAGEILYSWAHGQKPSGDHINAVVAAMQKAGLAGGGGVSSLGGLSQELTAEGVPNRAVGDWESALSQAGHVPILLGVGHAGVLPGDEIAVHGHFLTIEGVTAGGQYIASDPDNAATHGHAGGLVLYSLQDLIRAEPWGAILPTGTGLGLPGGGPGSGLPDITLPNIGGPIAAPWTWIGTRIQQMLSGAADSATKSAEAALAPLAERLAVGVAGAGLILFGLIVVVGSLVKEGADSPAGQQVIAEGKQAAKTTAETAAVAA